MSSVCPIIRDGVSGASAVKCDEGKTIVALSRVSLSC